MDGLGQLFIAQNGSVYALVQAESREPPPPPPRPLRGLEINEEAVTAQLVAQFLQRQQQQQFLQREQEEHEQNLRQQQLALQLDGLAAPNMSRQREGALHSLLQATLLNSYPSQTPGNIHVNAVPSTSSQRGASGPAPTQRGRRVHTPESPSNSGRSDYQSPLPSTRGGDRGERSNQNSLGVSAHLSAKEKNRQAQRRFRERQKDLITNLKRTVEDLQNKVADNEKEIIALKEENAMLRGRIEGKQQMSSVTLPAETLQSLLQMTGAGGLAIADVPRLKGGNGIGGGGSSGGASGAGGVQGYWAGRGGGDAKARVDGGGDAGARSLDAARRGEFGARAADAE